MGFASAYLEQRALFPDIIKEAPDKKTGIFIVIPAYNEPGIRKLLDSLALCKEPPCRVEVLIILNSPEGASAESLNNNIISHDQIESWKKENTDCFFRLFTFMAHPVKGWGVGLARKTGMDEAIRRFNSLDNPDGIILNLDADCIVAENYITSVYSGFAENKERSACSIYFEHPLEGSEFPGKIYEYITLYELHLRYYYQGLAYTCYPYVFHTVGSAIAVKALPYIKAGGMNRRQAGEDFYFIQKLVPAGGYFSITSTTVYPSPRPSFRVPFGTGASIARLNETSESGLYTYNFNAFRELKSLFGIIESFFQAESEILPAIYDNIPVGLKTFLPEEEFISKLSEIKENTSGLPSFKKRFFGWFNMFKVVKYLNFVHLEMYEKKPVQVSALELLAEKSIIPESEEPRELLDLYRKLERKEILY